MDWGLRPQLMTVDPNFIEGDWINLSETKTEGLTQTVQAKAAKPIELVRDKPITAFPCFEASILTDPLSFYVL